MSDTSKSDNRNTKVRSTSKPLILTSQGHAATTVARTADPPVTATADDSDEQAAACYSTSQGHAATTVARTADPPVTATADDSDEQAAACYSTSQGHAATTVARTADPPVTATADDSDEQAAACYSTSQGHAATTVARTADPFTQTAPIIHPVTASCQLSGGGVDSGSIALQAVRKKSFPEPLTPLFAAPALSTLASAVTSSWPCLSLTAGHLSLDSASTELTDLPSREVIFA